MGLFASCLTGLKGCSGHSDPSFSQVVGDAYRSRHSDAAPPTPLLCFICGLTYVPPDFPALGICPSRRQIRVLLRFYNPQIRASSNEPPQKTKSRDHLNFEPPLSEVTASQRKPNTIINVTLSNPTVSPTPHWPSLRTLTKCHST